MILKKNKFIKYFFKFIFYLKLEDKFEFKEK